MRLAGAALLVAAFALFGLAQVLSARRRARLVIAFISALTLLRAEITERLSPLPDCARTLAESGPEPCRDFFAAVYGATDALGEVEFAKLWSACLHALDLPRGALDALDCLGRSLGRYAAAEQGAAIDRCAARLEAEARAAAANARDAPRLRFGLSLAAGALLALILY